MKRILIVAAVAVLVAACSDEPRQGQQGNMRGTTTVDSTTTSPSDTTGTSSGTGEGSGSDTTGTGDTTQTTLTQVVIEASSTSAFAGQTIQLRATPVEAMVTWSSARSSVARVDSAGLVTVRNVASDTSVVITATPTVAGYKAATFTVNARAWNLIVDNGTGSWTTIAPSTATTGLSRSGSLKVAVTPAGGTTPLTGSDFNASMCSWSITTMLSSVSGATLATISAQPTSANGYVLTVTPTADAHAGDIFTVTATVGAVTRTALIALLP